ncbi:MAG: hypothetical protein WCC17_01395, partial [Candidatus Nitrosopolaris sp.]
SKVWRYASFMTNSWKRLLNYNSFHNLNREKANISKTDIVFSNYLYTLIIGRGSGGNTATSGFNVLNYAFQPFR